jgi:hypothetical protein
MKIAICFSGEPRFVEECYPLIRKNIIEKNDSIDFFVHTWYSEESCNKPLYSNEISSFGRSHIEKGVIQKIIDLYDPIKIKVERPIDFLNSDLNWGDSINKYFGGGSDGSITKEDFRRIKINNFYSFMYSNMKSLLLKKEYELSKDFKYDTVVRFRFDNIVKTPISFGNFDNRFLYYQEMGQPDSMISDWINFSNSEIMDSIGSIFLNFEYFSKLSIEKYNAFSPESLLRECCSLYGVESRPLSLGIEVPRHGNINL